MWGAFRRSSCTSHLCTEKPRCVVRSAVHCSHLFTLPLLAGQAVLCVTNVLLLPVFYVLHRFACCYIFFAFFTASFLVRCIKSMAASRHKQTLTSQVLQVLWKFQVDAHGMGWETKSSHSSDLRNSGKVLEKPVWNPTEREKEQRQHTARQT